MPADKGKVRAKLDEVLKGSSTTKNFKDALATKWAAKIDSDDDIDTYVDDRKEDLLEASKEADRRSTAASAEAKQGALDKLSEKKEDKNEEVIDDPTMPAWAKTLLEQNKSLTEKLSTFEADKTKQSIAERFRKDAKEKGIPEAWIKRSIPATDADYDNVLTDLTADYTQFATENQLSMIGGDNPSGNGGSGRQVTHAGKVDSDLASFAKAKSEAVTTNKN